MPSKKRKYKSQLRQAEHLFVLAKAARNLYCNVHYEEIWDTSLQDKDNEFTKEFDRLVHDTTSFQLMATTYRILSKNKPTATDLAELTITQILYLAGKETHAKTE